MIQFFKDLINGFKKSSVTRKIFYSSLILIYFILIALLTIKVNVEIITPGGINANIGTNEYNIASPNVFIDTDYNPGNIFTVGVHSRKRISLYQYLISKMNDDIAFEDYDPKTSLSKEEDLILGKKSKDVSIINALIVAYEEAKKVDDNINIDYEFEGVLVSYVFNKDSKLEPDDIITHLNDQKIEPDTFRTEIGKINNDENIKLTVKRYDSVAKMDVVIEITTKKYFDEAANQYLLGISTMDSYIIDEETAFPEFTIHKNYSSIGGSGGAMQALAIYNSILEVDITNGKTIIGTGTVSVETYNPELVFGQIGDIGGVSQKIVTANLYNADIFFVNPEDAEEAKQKAKEIDAKFEVVEVKTFAEIVSHLKGEN